MTTNYMELAKNLIVENPRKVFDAHSVSSEYFEAAVAAKPWEITELKNGFATEAESLAAQDSWVRVIQELRYGDIDSYLHTRHVRLANAEALSWVIMTAPIEKEDIGLIFEASMKSSRLFQSALTFIKLWDSTYAAYVKVGVWDLDIIAHAISHGIDSDLASQAF